MIRAPEPGKDKLRSLRTRGQIYHRIVDDKVANAAMDEVMDLEVDVSFGRIPRSKDNYV